MSGEFFEVTSDKQVVWTYTNPYPSAGSSVFRAYRYGTDYSGLPWTESESSYLLWTK